MLNDFHPVVKEFPTEKEAKIYPVYDLHVGSREFDEKRWLSFVKFIKSDPLAYIVIGGDLMDNGLKNSLTLPYQATMQPAAQKKYLAETLEPIKDRVLCGTSGNHEFRSRREADDNPLYDVFCKLDIEERFRENGVFLVCRFRTEKSHKRPVYVIHVTHGAGGGQLPGGQVNRKQRFSNAFDGVDIFLSGHTHRPLAMPEEKIVVDSINVTARQQTYWNVIASSWLNYGGYPMRGMLTPTAACDVEIVLNGNKKRISVHLGKE